MDQLTQFYTEYGWQITLIALVGIIILGILKYTKVFDKIKEPKPVYLAVSLGFSIIATIIYLLIIKQFEITYVLTVSSMIYAANQAMYSVYETTTLRDLCHKIRLKITEWFNKKKEEKKTK